MTNSVEDLLVDGLSFTLKPGSNIHSTNRAQLIKMLVSGDAWMDPSTFRVPYDLINNNADATKELRPSRVFFSKDACTVSWVNYF